MHRIYEYLHFTLEIHIYISTFRPMQQHGDWFTDLKLVLAGDIDLSVTFNAHPAEYLIYLQCYNLELKWV